MLLKQSEEKAALLKQCGHKDILLEQCQEQVAILSERDEGQKDMLPKEFEQEKAKWQEQYEQETALRKELEERNATLLKEYKHKDTLLELYREQMAKLSERCEKYERRDESSRGSKGGDRLGMILSGEFRQWDAARLQKEIELIVGSPPLFLSICFLISFLAG